MSSPDSRDSDPVGPAFGELAAIADGAQALIAYFDTGQRCRYANRRWQEWFGVPADVIAGRHIRGVVGEATYEALRPHVEAALSGRPVSHAAPVSLGARGTRWLAASFAPDAGTGGVIHGCIATILDITACAAMGPERVEAAGLSPETLREREARLRAILESAVDGIIAIDESGAIQSLNPAAERLFGYAEQEIVGRNVSLLMPPPYRDEHDGYLASYLRTSQARIIGIGREVEARRKNGEVFPIHLSVGEARLGSRRIFTGIIHDLTQRNRLQEQLAQSQKMEAVGRLAGGVAHDFNNVLQTVLTRCDAMLRGLPGRHPLRRQAAETRKAALRAAALTRQLLAVSRAQVLNPRLVDLNAVLRDTADMLSRLIGEDIDFRMELQPEIDPVKVDPDQIVQVVLNLVVNARDAMPRGGKLVVRTRQLQAAADVGPPGCAVVLEVRDTGRGMDEQTRARIFEPYFTTKGEKGTGLGLSTVYGIVQQSGGVIRVESRLGEGATFTVELPPAQGQVVPVVTERARSIRQGRGGRLLLVEDEAAARRALEEFLRDEGHTVLSARDGAEAERLWREARDPIDVVITDTVMPRLSGPELLQRLRAAQPAVKFIFMSGHTPETVLEHGGIGPGTAFLQKPFDVDDLLAKVGELLAESSVAPKAGRATGRTRQTRPAPR
jgi:PAS domain S-box-containing protein